jgi:hypothetical protein
MCEKPRRGEITEPEAPLKQGKKLLEIIFDAKGNALKKK